MAQEKPTSIRILQSHKKSARSPFILVVVGFLAGILVSVLGFLLFTQNSQHQFEDSPSSEAESPVSPTEYERSTLSTSQVSAHGIRSNQVLDPHLQTQQNHEEDEVIQQPKDSDLSRLFKHAPATPAVPHRSPFETKSAPIPAKPVTTHKVPSDPEKTPQNQTHIAMLPSEKGTTVSKASEKIESPHATVEISITRQPFEVQ